VGLNKTNALINLISFQTNVEKNYSVVPLMALYQLHGLDDSEKGNGRMWI
jgi:hypothetical protein